MGVCETKELTREQAVETISTFNQTAKLCFNQNQLSSALDYYKKAMDIGLRYFEKTDLRVLETFAGIATVHQKMGDIMKAKKYYKAAIKGSSKIGADRVMETMKLCCKVGRMLEEIGDFDEAIASFKQGKKHGKRYLCHGRVEILKIEFELVQLYRKQGNLEKATRHLDKCIHSLTGNNQKEGQALLAKCYNCEGLLLKSEGKFQDALISYKKSREITKMCLEEDHICVATVLFNIALIQQKKFGEFEKALNNLKKCLEIEIKWYGEESETVQNTKQTIEYITGFCAYDAKRDERISSIWSRRSEDQVEKFVDLENGKENYGEDENILKKRRMSNNHNREIIESVLTMDETNPSIMSAGTNYFQRNN